MFLAIEREQVRVIERASDAPEAEVIEVRQGKEDPIEVGDRIAFTEATYRQYGVFTLVDINENQYIVENADGLRLRPLREVPNTWRSSNLQMYVKLEKK